jgi:hypothetical protein
VTLRQALLHLDLPQAAVAMGQQAIASTRAGSGAESRETHAAIANLSAIYNDIGNYAHARPLAEPGGALGGKNLRGIGSVSRAPAAEPRAHLLEPGRLSRRQCNLPA